MQVSREDGCNEVLCLDCFWLSRLSERGEQIVSSSQNEVSMDKMRQVLNNRVGLQLNIQDITAVEVMELYEMYVSAPNNSRDNIHARSASEKIKFPFFSSEHIYGSNKLKRVEEKFPLSSGGRFISDKKTFSNNQIPLVLELLASLLKYDDEMNPKKSDDTTYIGEYEFLPTMFLHLAYYSRVDSGLRLLDRCARHTMDPKCKSIYYQDIEFFECDVNGEKVRFDRQGTYLIQILSLDIYSLTLPCFYILLELGFLLCNKIPASMKQEEYDVKVTYTKSGIVACECGCKTGSKDLDKVLCVHILPVLMQFVVFFIDDLGQNILVEMCNRWNANLDEISKKDSKIKQNIIQMMEVIGCSNQELAKAKVASCIKEVLEDFCFGTEKKKKIPLPPREDLLCPLCHLKIKSTHNSLESCLKKKRTK